MDASMIERAEQLAEEMASQASTQEDLSGLLRPMMKSALQADASSVTRGSRHDCYAIPAWPPDVPPRRKVGYRSVKAAAD